MGQYIFERHTVNGESGGVFAWSLLHKNAVTEVLSSKASLNECVHSKDSLNFEYGPAVQPNIIVVCQI